jgi:hypothetical protein
MQRLAEVLFDIECSLDYFGELFSLVFCSPGAPIRTYGPGKRQPRQQQSTYSFGSLPIKIRAVTEKLLV